MVRSLSGLQAFIDELKRRRVIRIAAAYVVGAIFVLEAGSLVFQGLLVPDWVYRALTVLVLVGFPIVLVLSWLLQWTAAGIRPEADGGARGTARPGSVRAFAFIGLGMVIVLVVMGLSVPYMYSRSEHQTTQQAEREGVRLAADGGTARMAVLPFISLTGDDDSGFADGLAEDVTATLAQVGGIDVVSRTTSESYRDSEKTARQIGGELGVGLILEGTIRRAGDRIRVTVQLIDARTDRHMWANSYDRDLTGDVFRTQSQLAQEIVAAVQAVVNPEQTGDAERRILAQRVANEGSELLSRVEPAYDAAAADLFAQSLDADSTNPVAHAGIAQTQVARAREAPVLLDSAARHAELAIRLDPDLPDAHAAQAFVLMMQGEMDSAAVALQRAIELDESGQAYETEWQARIRMISPEALDAARRATEASSRDHRPHGVSPPPTEPEAPGPVRP